MGRFLTIAVTGLALACLGGCAGAPLKIHTDPARNPAQAAPARLARAARVDAPQQGAWQQEIWYGGWFSGDPVDLAVLRTHCASGRVEVTEAYLPFIPMLTMSMYAPRTVSFQCLP